MDKIQGDYRHDNSACTHIHAANIDTDRPIFIALLVNFVLTIVQVVGGVVSGSLSLIADAIHNFSDAISLVIAFVARKIARRPMDDSMTFGYSRIELIAATVNYTVLLVIAIYLFYEAVERFFNPQPIEGWIVVVIASFAFVVDAVTAFLTFRLAKNSINIRAAFLHNLVDAMGSVAVIVGGTLIILYDWYIIDPIITAGISAYIFWHVWKDANHAILPLMLGAPKGATTEDVRNYIDTYEGVQDVHALRYFAIDERKNGLTAHVRVNTDNLHAGSLLKVKLKKSLNERFGINFCVLEIETKDEGCSDYLGPTAVES